MFGLMEVPTVKINCALAEWLRGYRGRLRLMAAAYEVPAEPLAKPEEQSPLGRLQPSSGCKLDQFLKTSAPSPASRASGRILCSCPIATSNPAIP